MKTHERPSRAPAAALNLKRILVPVDFSAASNNAVEYARRISERMKAQLIFIHVVESDVSLTEETLPRICADELKENAEENLRGLVWSGRNNGPTAATSMIRSGLPTHEIVEVAKESDVDLIVIATHGHTGWKHFAIGSTAERVVRAAPCSVLVVREKAHDFV